MYEPMYEPSYELVFSFFVNVRFSMFCFGAGHEPTNNEPFCEGNYDPSYDPLKLAFYEPTHELSHKHIFEKLIHGCLSLLMTQLMNLRMEQLRKQHMS